MCFIESGWELISPGVSGCSNPEMVDEIYTFHLDDGHADKGDVTIPVKKFWITALLGQFSIVYPFISWVQPFYKTVNTLAENEDS